MLTTYRIKLKDRKTGEVSEVTIESRKRKDYRIVNEIPSVALGLRSAISIQNLSIPFSKERPLK